MLKKANLHKRVMQVRCVNELRKNFIDYPWAKKVYGKWNCSIRLLSFGLSDRHRVHLRVRHDRRRFHRVRPRYRRGHRQSCQLVGVLRQ